jgi:hypothetical protein
MSLTEDERSRLEPAETGLTQQPVIREYVTERFIQTIEKETITNKFDPILNKKTGLISPRRGTTRTI